METYHIKLKVKGRPKATETFFQLMRGLDWDFPVGTGRIPEYANRKYMQCERCLGMVWDKTLMNKESIEKAAAQCKVTVKFKLFQKESECGGGQNGENHNNN